MMNKVAQAEYQRARSRRLKAAGICVSCAQIKAEEGKARCTACLRKAAGWQKSYTQQIARECVKEFLPKTPEMLYQLAKSEREVVSWAWRNPA